MQDGLKIGVNGEVAGSTHPIATYALCNDTNTVVWRQSIQNFDAALLKAGVGEKTLTVRAGDVPNATTSKDPVSTQRRRGLPLPDRSW